MTVNELIDFHYENYYKQIGFLKESNYCLLFLPTKLIEKIPDSTNAKRYYQSYLNRKNRKSVK